MKSFLRILILACGLGAGSFAYAATAVRMDSDPGDYIGGGQNQVFNSGVSYSASTSLVTVYAGPYTFQFEMPRGASFAQIGNYTGATRYPFNSPTQPGLSVFGDGRGCNRLSGSFEVVEAQFSGSGQLLRLALDFVQHCESGASALYGAVRINSDIPLTRTGPHAIAKHAQAVYGNEMVGLDASDSYERQAGANAMLRYLWTQTEGRPVVMQGAASSLATFTAPYAAPGGEILKFNLTVTDDDGHSDTDVVEVRVLSKSDPQTAIYFNSQAGDYIGQGRTFRMLPTDGDITLNASRGGVAMRFNGDTWYDLDFAPASGNVFAVGPYENAQRAPFADADKPGIDVGGDGRGCNTITGRFDVRQFVADGAGVPLRLRVDFEQHCGGGTAALMGSALYNYLPDGIPVADAGADASASAGQTVSLNGHSSSDDKGIVTYRWRQLSGPAVVLTGADASMASFVMPDLLAGSVLKFQLLVVDAEELTSADTTQVTALAKSSEPSSGGSSGGGALSPWVSMLGLSLWMLRRRRTLNN